MDFSDIKYLKVLLKYVLHKDGLCLIVDVETKKHTRTIPEDNKSERLGIKK